MPLVFPNLRTIKWRWKNCRWAPRTTCQILLQHRSCRLRLPCILFPLALEISRHYCHCCCHRHHWRQWASKTSPFRQCIRPAACRSCCHVYQLERCRCTAQSTFPKWICRRRCRHDWVRRFLLWRRHCWPPVATAMQRRNYPRQH